jgi:DnaK suppressor protein
MNPSPRGIGPEELPPLEDVRALLSELQRERDALLTELERRQQLEHAVSREAQEPRDSADLGAAQRDVDRFAALADRTAERIDAIQVAIERAAQGRFGICESCGEPVAIERIRAVPNTPYCLDCARRSEIRERRPAS